MRLAILPRCYFPLPTLLSDFPMRLNPGQQQAVEFVTAPAWCWQARVPVKLVSSPINRPSDPRLRLSGATYRGGDLTNKAAREMKERVGQTLGRKGRVG